MIKENSKNPLQLKSMNHISIVCRSLEKSLDFYQNVLGFFPVRRPSSLNFDGAWLFSCYGIGVHLLQSEDPENMPKITKINPKDNHFSFQCESMATVGKKLEEMQIEYVKTRIEEDGMEVDQLFFQDPDGMMIEVCNCDNLPVTPLAHDVMLSCSFNNKL
uniref:VOC domain-containing protein n=1 Tax=Salix viminalis TaxID=40686 RepID=A0A6N2MMH4_SALVM